MRIDTSDQDIENIFNRINNGIYDLQPDFQRDIVWNREKQQKLIDSILRGWHIPPIHLVRIIGKEVYEVLDGKQRLYSICNFLKDEFFFNAHFIPGIENFNELSLRQNPHNIFKTPNNPSELFLSLKFASKPLD